MKSLVLDYPIRPDFLAQVVIPRDLSAEEARKLGEFLLTLATDFGTADYDRIIGNNHFTN